MGKRRRYSSAAALSALALLGLLAACPSRSPKEQEPARSDASTPPRDGIPRIVIFVGDGLGRGQLEAASYFRHGETGELFLYELPMQGRISTASPSGITDSAASATAMATGVLTLNGRVGVDLDQVEVQNLMELAKSRGMATGIVTTTRLAHATPASFGAHVNSRNQYQDIALDLMELAPDLMLGGGRRDFVARSDERNLASEMQLNGYELVTTADELAAVDTRSRILGLFANDHLEYVSRRGEEDETPTLAQMSLVALEALEEDPEGFVLLIEGGRIDHAGHGNLIEENIHETLAFDDAVRAVDDWIGGREDITLLVTADHECGGLEVLDPGAVGELPNVSWRWGQHTNDLIYFFGRGPGAERFDGFIRDHRWIHAVAKSLIDGVELSPEQQIIPDGQLHDLLGPTVAQLRPSNDASNGSLERLTLAYDDRGLALGIEGRFRWDEGAVVVLLDVDYGHSKGLRSFQQLDDAEGDADILLSSLNLLPMSDREVAYDLALISMHGSDPKVEQDLGQGGLRGLHGPFGSNQELGHGRVAINFTDLARHRGAPLESSDQEGLEAYIPWHELYPGQEHPPRDIVIAAWAFQVNEDGSLGAESLPSYDRDRPNKAPAPLTIRPVLD